MKIIIDAFGGDHAPTEIIKGTLDALKEQDGFDVVFVGKEDVVKLELTGQDYNPQRVSVVNATEVITCDDTPTEAIRTKKDSSIVVAAKMLKDDESATAFVSAGSTGAVLTAAVLLTPRIRGVMRPALAPLLPTLTGGEALLLDCGANVDCKPMNLVQFAIMGSAYMREVKGVENPRVALLSNGTEDKKGCALTHEAFELLKAVDGINFVGNMEARDMLSGDYDVIVSDGFYGNIALKSTEGAVNALFSCIKSEIAASKMVAFGALLMKKGFKNIKNRMDYNKRGGAVLLGMKKIIVKAHGSSKAEAFKNSVLQAYAASSISFNDDIAEKIATAARAE